MSRLWLGGRLPTPASHNDVRHAVINRRWYWLGLIIIVLGVLFHQPLLVVIALLLLIVIGATDVWATYCLRNLRYTRKFSQQRALFGEQVTLALAIENAKMLPLPWLEIEDTIPRSLPIEGQQLRVSYYGDTAILDNLFSTRWYERVTRHYTIQCNARGVHKFGPTIVRSGDVFGFLSNEAMLSNWQYLLIYPLVAPLTRFNLPSHHPFGDRTAQRRLLEDPSRTIGIRDYVYGDSLRRVHWKATARTMQLQSKVYEATTTYTLVIFLNIMTQFDVVHGLQPEVLELAICAAASVADWALNEDYAVGLYANTLMFMPDEGIHSESRQEEQTQEEKDAVNAAAAQVKRRRIHIPPSSSEEQRKRIMEVLARIQPFFGSTLEEVVQAERSRLPAGATVVVITSTISDLLLDALVRVQQAGHAVTILSVGDTPLPGKLAGLTIHHLGGRGTWHSLEAAYSNPGENKHIEKIVEGFRL
jgi:uncharacterized protein (DUF58 family)